MYLHYPSNLPPLPVFISYATDFILSFFLFFSLYIYIWFLFVFASVDRSFYLAPRSLLVLFIVVYISLSTSPCNIYVPFHLFHPPFIFLLTLSCKMATPCNLDTLEAMFCFLYNINKRVHIRLLPHSEDPNFQTENHSKIALYYSHF